MSDGVAANPPLWVEAVTASVLARPGSIVPCTVRVHNDGASPLRFTVRVVGLGEDVAAQPVPWEPLAPGGVLDIEVPVVVPDAMVAGEHSVAIEVSVDAALTGAGGPPRSTPGRRPMKPTVAMAPMIVKVGSLEQVLLRTKPSVVRGRFRARFELEVINRREDAVTVDLAAETPGLRVEFQPTTVVVPPGDTALVAARVSGSHHWVGDDRQHIVNIEGSGSAVPSYTRVVFRERPVLARGLRGFAAALVVLSLWAGVLGGAAFWLAKRDTSSTTAANFADVNNDGKPDAPGTGTGTDGAPDAGGSDGGEAGAPGAAPGTDPKADKGPTSSTLRGTVKAGDTGDDSGVLVTLTSVAPSLDPADAGAPATVTSVTTAGFLGSPIVDDESRSLLSVALGFASRVGLVAEGRIATGGKFWPARYGTYTGSQLVDGRATVSVTAGSLPAGTWTIDDVPLRRSYEVSFYKKGFDRQSFQVTTPADPKPIELDVELVPASGALGGRLRDSAGALGGVELTVTDGTLTFSATTSTDPATLGDWIIEGLSTPSTYTVTATKEGYGALSAQEELGVGDTSTGLDYVMTKGVGAIGGTVTGTIDGAPGPLGGITLSVSGNGITRTTTSLSAGAVGSYLFPGLDVTGPYTITASAPGYLTETRLSLTGNATGVDFALKRATGTIIGRVMSAIPLSTAPPLPIAGVGVEITVNGLPVRTLSATDPDRGAFELGNLPPGTYTVFFKRYDHREYSQVVVVEAGEPTDIGLVAMEYAPRQQLNPSGSVSVSVVGPPGGATVRLVDVAGRVTIDPYVMGDGVERNGVVRPAETSHTFSAVPIGTYRVLVTHPRYRDYEYPRRVVVDLGDVPVEAILIRYGQAFGQVIDGLAPQITVGDQLVSSRPLSDYRLVVYKVTAGVYTCQGPVTVLPVSPKDPPEYQSIKWEVSDDLKLLSGDYVLRFTQVQGANNQDCDDAKLPNGYAARPDADGNVQHFTIDFSNDPLPVDDIAVFPFPSVRGVVFAPVWNNGVELQKGAAPTVGTATLVCGSVSAEVPLDPTGGVVTFEFTRETIATMFGVEVVPATGVLGACKIVVVSSGFVDVDRSLTNPLIISTLPADADGPHYDDRVVAVVLADDPEDLVGIASWFDFGPGGTLHGVGGARISADGVIVGFDVTQSVDSDGEDGTIPAPVPDNGEPTTLLTFTEIDTVDDAVDYTGLWGFTALGQQQLAGENTYELTAENFGDASFVLLIDGDSRVVTGGTDSGFAELVVDDGFLDLRLQPDDGSLSGSIDVVTTGSSTVRDEALVHATPPGGVAVDLVVTDGEYGATSAAAGTWQLDFRTEPDSNLVAAPVQGPQNVFVDAGQPTDAGTATYWDLAQLSVRFQDTNKVAVNSPLFSVAQDPVAADTYPAWTDRPDLSSPSGPVVVRKLSVSEVDPISGLVTYRLSVSADGYDVPAGSYEVFEPGNNTPIASGADPTSFTVDVVAGSRLGVVVTMPALGSISGTVTGLLRPPSTLAGDIEALDLDHELAVSVRRVSDSQDFPLDPTPPAGKAFGVSVSPGDYEITYSHPEYDTLTVPFTVGDGEDVDGSVNLDLARGTFELAVVTDDVSLAPVVGASVRLFAFGTEFADIGTAAVLYQGVTDTNGNIIFDPAYPADSATFVDGTGKGVIPGAYLLVVRKADPGPYPAGESIRDDHFPVIADISVPRGRDAAARTLKRRAVMPRTDGSLVGIVTARNLDVGSSLALPAGIVITRNVQDPQAGNVGTVLGVDNDATEGNLRPVPSSTADVNLTGGFSFQSLPAGEYTLTFPPIDGFTTPDPVVAQVDGVTKKDVGIIEYVATDVTWQVTFLDGNGDPVSGLAVSALGPKGDTINAVEIDIGVYEFVSVAPQDADYVLSFDSIYYKPVAQGDMSVTVGPSSVMLATSIDLTAIAIIEGSAVKLGTGGASDPLDDAGAITLRTTTGTLLQTAVANTAGTYRFEVAAEGDYRVQGEVSGYTIESVAVNGVVFGSTYTPAPDLAVEKFASATITVTDTPDDGTASVAVTPNTGVTVVRTGLVFEVTGLDPGQLYTFAASAPNRATRPIPATGSLDPDIGGTHPFTVALEALRAFTGVVTNSAGSPVNGAAVVLYDDGALVGTDTTDALGEFLFTDIGYGDKYTITAKKGGVGSGSTPGFIVVEPGSDLTVTGLDIQLAPRPVAVTFVMTYSAPGPIAVIPVPTVTLDGVEGDPGVLTFTLDEDAPMAYSIAAPGFITKSGSLSVATNAAEPLTLSQGVTLVQNVVSGEVTGLKKGDGNVTVRFCAGVVTTCVNPLTAVVRSTATGFSFPGVAPGTYIVWVTKGSGGSAVTVSATVTVTAAGATGAPVTLAYPP